MKKLLILLFSLLISLTSNVAWSASFNDGYDAYESGDYITAFRIWEPIANQGDENAQHNLGLIYYNGLGTPINYKSALKWYTLSANQGHPSAQNRLGWMYSKGEGTPINYKSALKWYTLSANQGNSRAQNNLGWAFYNGEGTPINYKTAFKWYMLSANQGDLDGHESLGIMYGNGEGVEESHILGYMHLVISGGDGEYSKSFMTTTEHITAKELVRNCKTKKNICTLAIQGWEKNKKLEKQEKEKIRIIAQARENSKNNPGFRDLKPGIPLEDYYKNCVPLYVYPNKCYGIKNIEFNRDTNLENGVKLITALYLDMGPITGNDTNSNNLYQDMVTKFNDKYNYEYGFSERDLEVFNAKQKKELLKVYSNGQVVIKISRKTGENTFLEQPWLDIEYRDVKTGKRFLEKNRPVEASLNDF